jgi:DNA-3-methyladenine glycosylase II
MEYMTWLDELETGITHIAEQDARLAAIIQQYPKPTFRPHTDYYPELVESIISQQLSVKAAATIYRRFVDSFGHVPEPAEILARDDTELRSVGLSSQKTRYIKDLASKVLDGSIHFDHLDQLPNDEVVAELTAVKGVGEWTVHMFLMFCMGRFDVLPVGDLGIKNAVQRVYDLPEVPTAGVIRNISDQSGWKPYESIASWYLWQSLENKPFQS